MTNPRSQAREMAFKLLFEDTFGSNTAEVLFGSLFEEEQGWADMDEDNKLYIEWVRENVKANQPQLDELIASFAKGWTIKRMSRVDLSLLRLALCEILYREDVPAPVSINEAVELAKKYSSDEGPAFINGILGAYIRSV